MKDAIIVRKVTGPSSHERKDWRRRDEGQLELFLIILLPIPRTGFLGGKIMHLTKKTRTEDNNHFFKESRTKSEEEIKRTSSISQRTRAGNRRFCESPKS